MKKRIRKRGKRVDWLEFGLAIAAQVLASIIVILLLIVIGGS